VLKTHYLCVAGLTLSDILQVGAFPCHLDATSRTPDTHQQLQKWTFYGKEQALLAYAIGLMNMILHEIEAPATHQHAV
jgi:hypothetical protein